MGRAITCPYCPASPDLHTVQFDRGVEDGLQGSCEPWVIDRPEERDVVVCDRCGKICKGTFLGGNLTSALHNRTGRSDADKPR